MSVEFRKMGLASVDVSIVGVGTNQFGGRVDQRTATAVVHKAVDLGINFIDTADSYASGVSEEFIGNAIKGRRHQFVIATKTGTITEPPGRLSRQQIVQKLDRSLKRLGTEYVDLYYLHFPDPDTSLEQSLRTIDEMVRAGKVLYPALSNHGAGQVAEAAAICERHGCVKPVVVQNEYNLLARNAELELLPTCERLGLSLVPYSPLAEGFLTGKYRQGDSVPRGVRGYRNKGFATRWLTRRNFDELGRFEHYARRRGRTIGELAIAWLLAQPLVCSVIAGVTSPTQLEGNVKAATWNLQAEDLRMPSEVQ